MLCVWVELSLVRLNVPLERHIIGHFRDDVCVCGGGLDERESVQKKTFAKWVNSHLIRVSCSIQDLYVDLRDGKMLIKLLEVLSGERLVRCCCCCCPIAVIL